MCADATPGHTDLKAVVQKTKVSLFCCLILWLKKYFQPSWNQLQESDYTSVVQSVKKGNHLPPYCPHATWAAGAAAPPPIFLALPQGSHKPLFVS